MQVAIDQKLQGNFNTNMQYRIGLTQSLGKNDELKPLINPNLDSDKDGIVDADDECPGLFGLLTNNGCPDSTKYIAEKIEKDSLSYLVKQQQLKIEDLELANAKLMSDANTLETSGADSLREQELLLRIDTMEKDPKSSLANIEQQINQSDVDTGSTVDTMVKTGIVYDDPVIERDEAKSLEQDKLELELRWAEESEAEKDQALMDTSFMELEIPEISEDKNYYVVTISSPNLSTAESWLIKMKKDFSAARLIPQANGYYRVGVFAAKDLQLAYGILKKVKQLGYNPAWISVE
jgi:hypothetical protein